MSFGLISFAFNFYKITLISMCNIYINYLNNNSAAMNSEIVQFSHRALVFNKDKPFILQITNKSQNQSVIFKIKTTKLNTYQVKPPLGTIQAGEKKNIQFKLMKPLTQQELAQARSKDKFQFQFLIIPPGSIPKAKADYKALWDDAKNDPQKQLNIANFTLPIQNDNEINLLATVNSEPFSPVKVKNSTSKSESKMTSVRKTFTLQADPKKDEQLSKQFQKLKEREEKLLQEREKVFKSQVKTEKESKGGAQIALIAIVFLLSVLIGNFLKLRVFVGQEL